MNNCYVNVCGGIGNQLFQIATGYAYSREYKKGLIIDPSGWSASQGDSPESYRNTIFQNFQIEKRTVPAEIIQEQQELKYNKLPFKEGSVQLVGYFQAYEYFRYYLENFKDKLTLPDIRTDYIEKNSIAFHIRRGDYKHYQHIFGNVYPYFHRMFDKFRGEDIHVYTDSPEEVLQEFVGREFKIFQQSSDLKDLTALTRYDRIVGSNSSFSWWGAVLGNAREIIMPDRWLLTVSDPDIYTDNMIRYEL